LDACAYGSVKSHRCDAVHGPSKWGGFCDDAQQSPINVCGATEHADVTIAALVLAAGYSAEKEYTFKSNGQAYIDASALGLSMTAGKLSQTVTGRSTNADVDTWNLAQAHFHWGRDKTEGSEHYIEGKQYALELHFVHVNSKYQKDGKPDIGGALASGNADALLVVGQMFEVGTSESAAMSAMMAQMGKGGETGEVTKMKASELMDTTAGFYTYPGSLTTPTCNAVVTWVVLASVLPIKESTLSQFMALMKGTEMVSKNGNFRPLQAKGTRVIHRTAEVKSPTCHTAGVREAKFTCEEEVKDDKSEKILKICIAALAMATLAAVAALVVAAKVFTMRSASSPLPFVAATSSKPNMPQIVSALPMSPLVGAGLVMPVSV